MPSFESLLNSIGNEKINFSLYHFTGLLTYVLQLYIFAEIIQAIQLFQRSWWGYPWGRRQARYDRLWQVLSPGCPVPVLLNFWITSYHYLVFVLSYLTFVMLPCILCAIRKSPFFSSFILDSSILLTFPVSYNLHFSICFFISSRYFFVSVYNPNLSLCNLFISEFIFFSMFL